MSDSCSEICVRFSRGSLARRGSRDRAVVIGGPGILEVGALIDILMLTWDGG